MLASLWREGFGSSEGAFFGATCVDWKAVALLARVQSSADVI